MRERERKNDQTVLMHNKETLEPAKSWWQQFDTAIFAKRADKPLQSIRKTSKRSTSWAEEINDDVLENIGKGQYTESKWDTGLVNSGYWFFLRW